MTESEFRRRPTGDRHGDDLRARLELVDEALLAIAGNVANGRVPADGTERDRCRLVGERIAAKGRRVVDLLARPPGVVTAGPPDEGASIADMIRRGLLDESALTGTRRAELEAHRAREDAAFKRELTTILLGDDTREQGEEP